jgi:hypothetical protein
LEIDLLPFAMPHLARSDEDVRCNFQCQLGDRVAFECIDGAQQLAQLLRFEDRGIVARLRRQQCTLQDGRRVYGTATGGCAIAEHPASE